MHCPELDEMERFQSSELNEERYRQVAQHIEQCEGCRSHLAELKDNRRAERELRSWFASNSASAEATVGSEIAGRYRIIGEIGRGGMGIVYEAEQDHPRRRVALKLLNTTGTDRRRHDRLLEREVQALARLERRSIAAIYDAGRTDDGRSYFAMELVSGQPLTAYALHRGLSLDQRLRLFADVCDAVAYAHQRGVIHRDLKPSNILVTADAAPKVLDFGLARIVAENDCADAAASMDTEPGRILGTLPYMSPEHVCGRPHDIDIRSDVYSLGVVLYELISGRLPYDARRDALPQAARIICEQAPASPSSVVPDLPGDVQTIILKSIEKDPEQRYASASEFAADIRRYLAHEPIAARPARTWYQFTKFVQRHRVKVACVALFVFALAGTAAAALRQAVIASQERDTARRRLDHARQAANYVLWGVGSYMSRVPGTGHIQRHLAEESYVFHRRLADERPNDPGEQVGLWRSLRTLCIHSVEVGDNQRARLLVEMLRGDVERIEELQPGCPEVERAYAQIHHLLATIAEFEGDEDATARHARDAVAVWRRRVSHHALRDLDSIEAGVVVDTGPTAGDSPDIVQDFGNLASACLSLARWTPDIAEAEACAQEAREIIQELNRTDPTRDPIYRAELSEYAPLAAPILLRAPSAPIYDRWLAEVHQALAEVAAIRGDDATAGEYLATAMSICEKLSNAGPNEPANIASLADTQLALSRHHGRQSDATEARQHGLAALAGYQRLTDSDPASVRWQRRLIETYETLSLTAGSERLTEVEEWRQAALALKGRIQDTARRHRGPP